MYVSSKTRQQTQARPSGRPGGFTLIELLIVIGIIMLLTAIVLGSITRLGASNRRVTCQSNLAQIYQACRLYQQDEGGFPFYDGAGTIYSERNLGLWALYAFPKTTSVSVPDPDQPLGRYIRSTRVFHCPQDNATGEVELMSGNNFNPDYLSYQKTSIDDGVPSYQSIRTTDASSANLGNWKRQLVTFNGTTRVYRAPADSTIITWCPYHRKAVGGRDFDNVLFYDGSVQLLPRQEDDGSVGWQRLPKAPQ